MNREIKFRGKRIDNGEWVYGDLLQPTEICDIYEIANCKSIDGTRYEVIPETIGQFTEMYDKYNCEIYVGDIVDVTKPCIEERGVIVSKKGCFFIKSNEILLPLYLCKPNNYKIKIRGNITDNPELLGGEDE